MKQALARLFVLALLAACGGGSDQAPDSQNLPDAAALDGAPCSRCRAGWLGGVAAAGGPLADAEVRIIDAEGHEVVGRTDAQGRYELPVNTLRGALLVQVTGLHGGQPVQWHGACRAAEVGTRAVNVTPLTELVVAQALGGRPADRLREGRVDFFRLDAATLRQAELAVEGLVRPLLNAAGVPAQVDLRVTEFAADGRGLDRALGWLELQPHPRGYALRHVAMAADAPAVLQPGQLQQAAALPAFSAAQQQAAQEAADALPALEQRLAQFSALFANGLPDADTLRAQLAPGLRDGGLDAEAYIARVLLRQDAPDQGGFSLQGARWHGARLLAVAEPGAVQLRVQLSLPAPLPPASETMGWVRSGGSWLARGDGTAARAQVRHLAVLGPQALAEAAVRQLPGVVCPAVFELLPQTGIDQRCHIGGGAQGLPQPGVLDLGSPGEALFGTLGLFHSVAETPLQRLHEQRQHSRLLATPSRRVQRHLSFELDARRVDPRAVRAQVFGPGLPAAGLPLLPPLQRAGAPLAEHWRVPQDVDDDWQAVALGGCEGAADAAEAEACRAAWDSLGAGATYRFVLLDEADRVVGEVGAALADAPPAQAWLEARTDALFARFDLAGQPALQPRLEQVLGAADDSHLAGERLDLSLPWRAPSDRGLWLLPATLDWWRAAPDGSGDDERVRRQGLPATGAALRFSVDSRPAYRGRWLVARLQTQDALGRRYLHFVAPNNPQ